MNRHVNAPAPPALFLGALICISLCWASLAPAQSSEEAKHEFDIPALPLSQALQEFSKQATLQYGYIPNDPAEEKIVVQAVKGRYTVQEALAILLPDGFTFAWVNARTISVLSPPANLPPGGVNESVVAKDQPRSEMSQGQRLSMANGGGKSGSARGPYDWDVLVEATKIPFGTLDLDVPVTVMDRGQIKARGASTVADLFRYLTQQTHTMSESYLGDGTQFADLRGLGFDTTLVLINGHRAIATASSLNVNAFDLNSIPLGAVERVEIVSDSTSAMHGADAIGGVVNIVLRDDIPQPTLDVDYGAAAGGAVERHAAFGASGVRGRARGSVVLDYFDRSPLLGSERDRWNNQDFTRFGSVDWRSPTASPGNVASTTRENLPGLPSTFAAIPDVAPGAALTPADFLQTSGQRNLESLYRYQPVSEGRTRKGVSAQGEYSFAADTKAYAEFLYADRTTSTTFEPPALSSALVPATNPYNPFDTDVFVDVLLKDLAPQEVTYRGELLRAVGGMKGAMGDWQWEASLHRMQDDVSVVRTRNLDPARVATALAATDADQALNVFGHNNPALLASLLAEPERTRYHTGATQSTINAHGPAFSLPAGPVRIMAGGEWRAEDARYTLVEPVDVVGSHRRNVAAAFAEVSVPLLDRKAGVPAVFDLSLVLSGRLDDYSDIGTSFNPEYALIWRPVQALTLRTSLAKSFRPPPLFDLYLPPLELPVLTADPARNGELAFPIWRAGGSPDLKPSIADSFTTTLKFAPNGSDGPQLEASYWRIRMEDTIGIPSATRLLAAEDRFGARIVRAQPSAADLAAGLPGTLQMIDVTRMNFGSVHTSGIDLGASATFVTWAGRFSPNMTVTWTQDFVTSDLIAGPEVRRVDVANAQGSVPRWKAIADLIWSRGGLSAAGTLRYVPSYDDVDLLGNRNGRRVSSQTLIDAQLVLDLGDMLGEQSIWADSEVRLGVLNLLDVEPPFAEVDWLNGYDLSQGDLRQRFAYLKLAKRF
ncbi:MAG TPA: TonB-dependent receptor [Steroidobacteraceae bacterium]|nr:TonB-dependent receptor [Steroidobacteraceae bacterium]